MSVGIVSGQRLSLHFHVPYTAGALLLEGPVEAVVDRGAIRIGGHRYDALHLHPKGPDGAFSIEDVTIGVHFHWERQETQTFRGSLSLILSTAGGGDSLVAINVLPVEDYLTSVISSEMSANAGLELLKAHAVISRSWLLAQKTRRGQKQERSAAEGMVETEDRRVKWYDREDHTLFDVCADDHCQRYQGITRQTNPQVQEAIAATRGVLMMSDGDICDARFSKCCGGAVEEFQYCWENIKKPYLRALADNRHPMQLPDLTDEATADRWIRSAPEAFCNTKDARILSQVLNNYDQETTNFYRWQVTYSQEELAALLQQKLGVDFGQIVDLQPVERGRSGRLCLLRIVGTRRTLELGKELEIRRALSPSHLYSSAFVADRHDISPDGIPAQFALTGAGWGHGVGLCQIGAAVMGSEGYGYEEILKHYYPGVQLVKQYQ